MNKQTYEAKRADFLGRLREVGFKSPSTVFRKLGPDGDWESQIDNMMATYFDLCDLRSRQEKNK